MNTYLVLSYALAGILVVPLVNAAKRKTLSEEALFLAIIGFSAAIGILVVMYLYRHLDPATAGSATAYIFFFSQVAYRVGSLLAKWLEQKEAVTTEEVAKDTENAVEEIQQEAQAIEGVTPEAQAAV